MDAFTLKLLRRYKNHELHFRAIYKYTYMYVIVNIYYIQHQFLFGRQVGIIDVILASSWIANAYLNNICDAYTTAIF